METHAQLNARSRAYYRAHVDVVTATKRRSLLKMRYGITPEEQQRMLAHQKGRCAICQVHRDQLPQRRLSVDHSHETGAVRGLLCIKCNTMIALADEDALTLARAMRYLNKEVV